MAIREYLLTTNEFNEPTVAKNSSALALLITRLLLFQPGTDPLHPEMGVGLGPKYRYITVDDMPTLQNRLEDQLQTYLPPTYVSNVSVSLSITSSRYLKIIILANDTSFVYDTESSDTPISISDL